MLQCKSVCINRVCLWVGFLEAVALSICKQGRMVPAPPTVGSRSPLVPQSLFWASSVQSVGFCHPPDERFSVKSVLERLSELQGTISFLA